MRIIASLASLSLLLSSVPAPAQIGAGYTPTDRDERGIWLQVDEQEKKLQTSQFVIRDPALNAYVRGVLCRTVGEDQCGAARIYLMRTPYFNASMAPNGMMQVWSGLFLRVRDESQLAAVLGHEFAHYQNRDSLHLFRSAKGRGGAAAWFSLFGLIGAVGQLAMIGSLYQFSRDMETRADAASVGFLIKAGYDPTGAARIWEELRAEMDATAAERNQRSRKDRTGGMFATHPPTLERMSELKALAGKGGKGGTTGRDSYRAALAPFWSQFLDDQIKLNDFGATEYLLADLAREGWTPDLHYARGELYRSRGRAEDLKRAADFYRQAIAAGPGPVESWRGLGLALLRSGDTEGGRAALRDYLQRKPDAGDRAMIAMLAGS